MLSEHAGFVHHSVTSLLRFVGHLYPDNPIEGLKVRSNTVRLEAAKQHLPLNLAVEAHGRALLAIVNELWCQRDVYPLPIQTPQPSWKPLIAHLEQVAVHLIRTGTMTQRTLFDLAGKLG